MGWPILSLVTFLPLAGALIIVIIRGDDQNTRRNIYWTALWTTLMTFILSLFIWASFNPAEPGFQMVERHQWLGASTTYAMGVDGISMLFVILTTFLMPICIVASELSVTRYFKEYMIAFLVMETLMIGVFTSLDLVL